jgi:hypothetical protein
VLAARQIIHRGAPQACLESFLSIGRHEGSLE